MNDGPSEVNLAPQDCDHDYIAFYGTLLRDEGVQRRLGVSLKLKSLGMCVIPGELFDLGEFPGLIPGQGEVRGELYQIRDATVLAILDNYEGSVSDSPSGSLYTRRRVRLLEPEIDAWVYHYNGDTAHRPAIRSGSWIDHLRTRS